MHRLTCGLLLVLGAVGCREEKLRVEHITPPDYPIRAKFENAQGTVVVHVMIGVDGKVVYAKGSGAPDILVQEAESNVRQWVFGPFPPVSEFPIDHEIQYVFKLEGRAQVVDHPPTSIKTFLPDRIEITALPLYSDYPPAEAYKPIPKQPKK